MKQCERCSKDFSPSPRSKGRFCSRVCAHNKHGASETKAYKAYYGMLQRCFNQKRKVFRHYGGRGITVSSEWANSFDNFYKDMGDPGDNESLDRIDNNRSYSRENCRWATKTEQSNNTRVTKLLTHNGKTLGISQWSRALGIPRSTIWNRLSLGLSVSDALMVRKFKKGQLNEYL